MSLDIMKVERTSENYRKALEIKKSVQRLLNDNKCKSATVGIATKKLENGNEIWLLKVSETTKSMTKRIMYMLANRDDMVLTKWGTTFTTWVLMETD